MDGDQSTGIEFFSGSVDPSVVDAVFFTGEVVAAGRFSCGKAGMGAEHWPLTTGTGDNSLGECKHLDSCNIGFRKEIPKEDIIRMAG